MNQDTWLITITFEPHIQLNRVTEDPEINKFCDRLGLEH